MPLKIDPAESLRILIAMTLIIMSFFLLSVLMTYLSRASYEKGLSQSIEAALNSSTPPGGALVQGGEAYYVGERVQIKSMLETSCALFKVQSAYDDESASDTLAAVARVATSAGPFPAVFLCNPSGDVRFISFLNLSGRMKSVLPNISTSQIKYWENRIKSAILTTQGAAQ